MKKKIRVVTDRAAEGPAKLVLAEGSAGGRKVVARVQIGIAQKIECVAMKSIASGLGDDIDLAAAEFSILRVEVAGDDAEFINRIQVGNDGRAGVDVLFHVGCRSR